MASPSRRFWRELAVLVLAAQAYALSQTIVVPALPEIEATLGAPPASGTWVVTTYLVTASVATPLAGRLGDMFGKKRLLIATLAVCTAGSVLAACATSLGVLIAGRALQGVSGAVFPLAFGIIRDDQHTQHRAGLAIGVISATFGIGGGIGLVISGLVVDALGTTWLFWLGAIIAAVALAAVLLTLQESPHRAGGRIDWAGAALLSGGLVVLLMGISDGNGHGWTSPAIVAELAGGLILLAVWVWVENSLREPLVDMRMMRNRAVLTTNLTALLIGFGMFGAFLLLPQLVTLPTDSGVGFGASVTVGGLATVPTSAAMLLAGPLAGGLGARHGFRPPLLIGTLLAMSAFVLLALQHGSLLGIYAAATAMGVGIGSSLAAMGNLVVNAVPPDQTAVAAAMNTILRTIGGTLGVQVSASVVAATVVSRTGWPTDGGFTVAFCISATALLSAFVLALGVPRALATPAPAARPR